jgi:hypothetical protein
MNAIVDYAAFMAFVFLTTTGVLMRYLLPPGSGRHTQIWGLDRHEWGTVHFWISLTLFGILALHIILHWKWIISVIKGKPRQGSRSKFLLGTASLFAVVALGISPIISPVEVDERARQGREQYSETSGLRHETDNARSYDDVQIYGAMTLTEVSQETGVPVSYITQRLGIDGLPTNQRIGRLGREYGFDVENVRSVVAAYQKPHKDDGERDD